MKTICPYCGQEYPETPDEYLGGTCECQNCHQDFVVEKVQFCQECGTANAAKAAKCRQCGKSFISAPPIINVPKITAAPRISAPSRGMPPERRSVCNAAPARQTAECPPKSSASWIKIASTIVFIICMCAFVMGCIEGFTGIRFPSFFNDGGKAAYEKGQRYADEKNYVEAVKWFRKAAEQGLASGQYNLGVCYMNGNGVAKNPYEAVTWYRKAAEQGFASGQNSLGACYIAGIGVAKDPTEAVKWFRKAAEQGDADAQCFLGACYVDGIGVAKDPTEAVKWIRKAAEQGHAKAREILNILEK